MKSRRRSSNPLFLIIVIVLSAFASFFFWRMPLPDKNPASAFDTEAILSDISVIAADRHSVAHPEARAEVRDFLIERLESMGAELSIYHKDSIESRGFVFDIDNLVADFPVEGSESVLAMVAHYDSRYPLVPIKDTTCSYGAADDGYGVAVILETLSIALEQRDSWKQGLRVIFTDAEEVGMIGMKDLYAHHKQLFDDVGLMINLEARGPFGPALLFETSPGSDKLIEFYARHSSQHHTYSLTNVVYSFMPNFTDFKVVKDSIPGYNFSTIADINHYHTTLDNMDNVSPRSIRHYGTQLVPMVLEYLCSEEYSDRNYFRSDDDRVFFSIPVLGLFNFSKGAYIIINIALVLLMILLLILNRCRFAKAFKHAAITLGISLAALAFGLLMTWIGCLISGAPMKPFGLITGMMFDNALMIVAVVMLVIMLCFYHHRNSEQEVLFGAYLAAAILSLALLFVIGESMFFMIVFGFSVLAMFLYQLTEWKIFLLAGIALSCLHMFSFLYSLAMALTVGALGAVLLIAVFDLMMLIPLCREYIKR